MGTTIWFVSIERQLLCDADRLQFVRWTAIEVTGCVLDLGAVVFAVYLVWSLQMPLKKRMSVTAIFATRLMFVSCASAPREMS